MRELKFRAWIYKNSGETSITQRMVYSQGDLEAFFEQAEMWVDTPIMQFTGLHDKNGKEIYEGDVVNFAQKKTFCECEAELEYNTGSFCPGCGKKLESKDFITVAKIEFYKGSFAFSYYDEDLKFSWSTYIAENYIKWVEVIGNIYEDSHLLE